MINEGEAGRAGQGVGRGLKKVDKWKWKRPLMKGINSGRDYDLRRGGKSVGVRKEAGWQVRAG